MSRSFQIQREFSQKTFSILKGKKEIGIGKMGSVKKLNFQFFFFFSRREENVDIWNNFSAIKNGHTFAILCNNAVVEEVLNRPNALRLSPWMRQASTAPHKLVTAPDSSCTNFFVTASSINCFTSFLTIAISFSLNSISEDVANVKINAI